MSRRIQVLLVDDDPADRELASRALQQGIPDVEIDEADSRSAFLELLQEKVFDVIVSDYALRGFNGLDVIDLVHSHGFDTPIILMTGTGTEEVAVEAMKRGVADYVIKSIAHIKRLPATVEYAISVAETERARQQAETEKQRFESIIHVMTDFVGISDLSGRIFYLNSSGRELIGIGADEELLDLSIASCAPDWASLVLLQTGIPTAIRDGSWSGETALCHRDGLEIPVSQVILAHTDAQGNTDFLSTIARDIREQKRMEQEARQKAVARARLQLLSPREAEVLDLIVSGKTNKAIAGSLNLSVKTIEKHRSNLMKKLRVRTMAELVQMAIRNRL